MVLPWNLWLLRFEWFAKRHGLVQMWILGHYYESPVFFMQRYVEAFLEESTFLYTCTSFLNKHKGIIFKILHFICNYVSINNRTKKSQCERTYHHQKKGSNNIICILFFSCGGHSYLTIRLGFFRPIFMTLQLNEHMSNVLYQLQQKCIFHSNDFKYWFRLYTCVMRTIFSR